MAVRFGLGTQRKAKLERELERLVAGLKAMGAQRIILFGSLATGEVRSTSDLDLMVIMPSEKRFMDRLKEVYETLLPAAADIMVYTPEEFEEMSRWSAFVQSAIKKGKVVYEA